MDDQAWKDFLAGRITFEQYAKVAPTAKEGLVNANAGVSTTPPGTKTHQAPVKKTTIPVAGIRPTPGQKVPGG